MYAFRYTFFPARARCDVDEFIERPLWGFINELLVFGQARGDGRLVTETEMPTWYGFCEEFGSLRPRFHSQRARRAYSYLLRLSSKAPEREILGRVAASLDVCSCEERPALLLYSSQDHVASPLICLRCGLPVPLYRLPALDSTDRYGLPKELQGWQKTTAFLVWMYYWFHEGERYAARKLSSVESTYFQETLELRAALERRLRLPVYAEVGLIDLKIRPPRVCPKCGGRWVHKRPLVPPALKLGCRRCRLIIPFADRQIRPTGFHPLTFQTSFTWLLEKDRDKGTLEPELELAEELSDKISRRLVALEAEVERERRAAVSLSAQPGESAQRMRQQARQSSNQGRDR